MSETRPKFLALGDSYTAGEGIPPQAGWQAQLADRLRQEGIPLAKPIIVAQTGWTTGELLAALNWADLRPPYDLVGLLIGVNNQYRGLAVVNYRDEFGRLLDRAIAYAGGRPERVLVLSIPDWSATPYAEGLDRQAISQEIDAFNAANRQIAEELGVHYVDITPVTRQAGSDPDYLAADGLHPSGNMYALWADLALPAARMALQKPPVP